MNTKGKIDFTKTDNIQFIEEVASEISKEDKNWQWEARFHDFIQHRSEIRFVKGRLKFGNSKQAAPFPSMVVIFRGAGM